MRLFDRSTRRVEPTPAGRVLLERARRLLILRDGRIASEKIAGV